MLFINLHPLKHSYVQFFSLVKFRPYFEMCNMLLDTFTQKIHNYFKVPYHLMFRKHVILIIY